MPVKESVLTSSFSKYWEGGFGVRVASLRRVLALALSGLNDNTVTLACSATKNFTMAPAWASVNPS